MSRKSWPEVRIGILSAQLEATPYEITRYDYENMPIEIYRKFQLQKLKIFR